MTKTQLNSRGAQQIFEHMTSDVDPLTAVLCAHLDGWNMQSWTTATSNEGELDSASAVLLLRATHSEYNQPMLRIEQNSDKDGAAATRIGDPNPDIEFVEILDSDQQPHKIKALSASARILRRSLPMAEKEEE